MRLPSGRHLFPPAACLVAFPLAAKVKLDIWPQTVEPGDAARMEATWSGPLPEIGHDLEWEWTLVTPSGSPLPDAETLGTLRPEPPNGRLCWYFAPEGPVPADRSAVRVRVAPKGLEHLAVFGDIALRTEWFRPALESKRAGSGPTPAAGPSPAGSLESKAPAPVPDPLVWHLLPSAAGNEELNPVAMAWDTTTAPPSLVMSCTTNWWSDSKRWVVRIGLDGRRTVLAILTEGDWHEVGGIAIRPDGGIVVADPPMHRILLITRNGEVSILAGTGRCRSREAKDDPSRPATEVDLDGPHGLAVSPSGEVVFAEKYTRSIRKITAQGTLQTVARCGLPPLDLALAPDGRVIFAAEGSFENRVDSIWEVSLDGDVRVLAGGKWGYNGDQEDARKAWLRAPKGLAVTADNEVIFCDSCNHLVRKITRDGRLVTLAGAARNLDRYDDSFRPLDPPLVSGKAALFREPMDLVVVPGGVVVAEKDGIDRPPRFIGTTPSGEDLAGQVEQAIAAARAGREGELGVITAALGLQAQWPQPGEADHPRLEEQARALRARIALNAIRHHVGDRSMLHEGMGAAVARGGDDPLAVDPVESVLDRFLWDTPFSLEEGGTCQVVWDPTPTVPSVLVARIVGGECQLLRIGLDGKRTMVARTGSGELKEGLALPAYFAFHMGGIAIRPDGGIVFADAIGNRTGLIRKGQITTLAGTGEAGRDTPTDPPAPPMPATQAKLDTPFGVVCAPDGSILFTEYGNRRVCQINAEGTLTTLVELKDDRRPHGIACAPDGRVLLATVGQYMGEDRISRLFRWGDLEDVERFHSLVFLGGGPDQRSYQQVKMLTVTSDNLMALCDRNLHVIFLIHPDGRKVRLGKPGYAEPPASHVPMARSSLSRFNGPLWVEPVPGGGLLILEASGRVRYLGAGGRRELELARAVARAASGSPVPGHPPFADGLAQALSRWSQWPMPPRALAKGQFATLSKSGFSRLPEDLQGLVVTFLYRPDPARAIAASFARHALQEWRSSGAR